MPFACSDFTVVVRDDESGGDSVCSVRAHKVLLSRCAYFETLFASGLSEALSGRVVLHSNANGVTKLLQFIYAEADVCSSWTGDDCVDVLIASNRLLLPRLKELMEVEIQKAIDETNCGFLHEVGVMADSVVICDCCVDFAAHNFESFMRHTVSDSENYPRTFLTKVEAVRAALGKSAQ